MESDLARRAAAAAETPEERLAHIEERIAALHEAEKAFARTQAELAARSADLANRGTALAENARLGVVDAGPVIPSRAEMDELDERLRRLERETRDATKEHGFGDSLRALEARGLRGSSPAVGDDGPNHWTARGVSSAGRAPALQAGGRRFDPGTLHSQKPLLTRGFLRSWGQVR